MNRRSCLASLLGLLPFLILSRFLLDTGSQVELAQRQLVFTDRIGPFRRRQSRPIDQIGKFTILGPDTYFGRRWRRRRVNNPLILAVGSETYFHNSQALD